MGRRKSIVGKTYTEGALVINQTHFWAERGLIHCDGPRGYQVMTVRQFLRHANGLCDMLGNSSARTDHVRDAALRAEYLEITERAHALAARAQEQGMPEDPSACRDLVRRRPTTVCMAGDSTYM